MSIAIVRYFEVRVAPTLKPSFASLFASLFASPRNSDSSHSRISVFTQYPRKVVNPCVALALHRMDVSLGPRW